jgi:ATP-dependent RNA helicase DeaD
MPASFASLGLGADLLAPLAALGYEEPTHIQREAIPLLLAGRDVLGQAATGTGKTAAFALPLLARLPEGKARPHQPAVLVLVPTRELANQVAEAFHRYGGGAGRVVLPIYGGQDFRRQLLALKRGAHVVVATPGRALDHLRQGTLQLSALGAIVLDEADEMLDMGFAEDIETILNDTPDGCQVALFAATMPPRIAAIAATHLTDPARVLIPRETTAPGDAPRVRQVGYVVPRAQRLAALGRILDVESPRLALVFCRTRLEVDELAQTLVGRGFRVEALHGGMSQDQRERVMKQARAGLVDLLVATDVAARGIDIGHLSHVVNFGVPESSETYVHRIGRTGRAGREGVAITIAEPREQRLVRNIERQTRQLISLESVPTVNDVRARKLETTRAALREVLEAGGLETFHSVAEGLAEDFDPLDVAAAAVKLAHEAASGGGAPEERGAPAPAADAGWREPRVHGAHVAGSRDADRSGRGAQQRPPRGPGRSSAGMVRIRVGIGRKGGVRPGDLVGAIANESGIDARAIGAIDIADGYSLVEVDGTVAERVIGALSRAWLKGQRVEVGMESEGGGGFTSDRPRGPPQHARGGAPRGKRRAPRK